MIALLGIIGILFFILSLIFGILGRDHLESIKPYEARVCYTLSGFCFIVGIFMIIIAIAG